MTQAEIAPANGSWRQLVARLMQLIRLPLNPHDPPRIPTNSRWAIEQTWRAIESGEKLSAEGYLKLGNIAFGQGEIERAVLAYHSVTRLDSVSAEMCKMIGLAHQNSARVYFHLEKLQEARKAIMLAVAQFETGEATTVSELAESLLLQAAVEKRSSNSTVSHQLLTRALVLCRQHSFEVLEARCWVQFAHLDYADHELAAAKEKIRKALDLLALGGHYLELVRTYYNAALLSAESGDTALAIHQLERSLELMTAHRIEYGNGKVASLLGELQDRLKESTK